MTPAQFVAETQLRLRISEGCESTRYFDSLGVPTIGIGFNLLRHDAALALAHCGCLNAGAIVDGEASLSDRQIDDLFAYSFAPILSSARASLQHFDKLNDPRKFVVCDLVYNLGAAGWSEFVGTRNLIDAATIAPAPGTCARLYGQAADHLTGSAWFGQVGDRARRDVAMMRTGAWVSRTGNGSY